MQGPMYDIIAKADLMVVIEKGCFVFFTFRNYAFYWFQLDRHPHSNISPLMSAEGWDQLYGKAF